MDEIRRLVASDHLEKAIERLLSGEPPVGPEARNELTSHQAKLARTRKESRRGLLSHDEEARARTQVAYAVLELVQEREAGAGSGELPDPDPGSRDALPAAGAEGGDRGPSVFLSYNHGDAETALRIQERLEAAGIQVRIDREAMRAGEGIESFIQESVRGTDVTLALVSGRSLLSAWVALEAATTFAHEEAGGDPRFIACYLEDDFFRPDFLLHATDGIDARIAEIDALLPGYAERKLDSVDLNGEKSRLFKLRNNLGEVLTRLRGSLTLDVRGDAFDESLQRIVETLRA